MPNIDVDHADLLEDSWRQVRQLLETGKATRKDGSEYELSSRDYSALLRWVASLKPTQRRTVGRVEDFLPVETDA